MWHAGVVYRRHSQIPVKNGQTLSDSRRPLRVAKRVLWLARESQLFQMGALWEPGCFDRYECYVCLLIQTMSL